MSSLQRFFWFLKHPKLYPEAIRKIQRKINYLLFPERATYTAEARAKAQKEATAWCEKYAIDTRTAILKITRSTEFEPFEEKFQTQLRIAKEIVEECPVKMGGSGNLDLIYQLAEYIQVKYVIETGVSYGWSSLAFLLSLKNRNDSMLISSQAKYVGVLIKPKI